MTPACWWPLIKPVVGLLIAWAEVVPVWGDDAGRPDRPRGPPDARSQLPNSIASPKGTAS
jgi:hypothetical protein